MGIPRQSDSRLVRIRLRTKYTPYSRNNMGVYPGWDARGSECQPAK